MYVCVLWLLFVNAVLLSAWLLDHFNDISTDSSHELLELQLFMFEQIDLHIFKAVISN